MSDLDRAQALLDLERYEEALPIVHQVIARFRRLSKTDLRPGGPGLSDREREVLQLVARGHTDRAIGEQLFISAKTVENHVRNTLAKLHLSRRDELIRYALEHGIE